MVLGIDDATLRLDQARNLVLLRMRFRAFGKPQQPGLWADLRRVGPFVEQVRAEYPRGVAVLNVLQPRDRDAMALFGTAMLLVPSGVPLVHLAMPTGSRHLLLRGYARCMRLSRSSLVRDRSRVVREVGDAAEALLPFLDSIDVAWTGAELREAIGRFERESAT